MRYVLLLAISTGLLSTAVQAGDDSTQPTGDKPAPSMSVSEAIEAINSPRALHQEKGAVALYEWGPKASRAVPAIVANLKKDGPEVRIKLLHVLIAIGPAAKETAGLMTGYLDHPVFHVRYLACRVLGQCADAARPAVPKLIELASDPITSVRRRAIEALGNLGPHVAGSASKIIVERVSDPRHVVKVEAILAAGKFGAAAKDALPQLRKIARDRKSSERSVALQAIWMLTDDADAVVPGLCDHMEHADLPWEGAQVLAFMGPAGKDAVPALIKALDGEPSLQVAAAEALGEIGTAARPAIPALKRLQQSSEPELQVLAREVIRQIQHNER